jgi:hypothetical protein
MFSDADALMPTFHADAQPDADAMPIPVHLIGY